MAVILLSEGISWCRIGLYSTTGIWTLICHLTVGLCLSSDSLLVPGPSGEQKCLNLDASIHSLCGYSWQDHIPVRFSWLARSCAFRTSLFSGERYAQKAVVTARHEQKNCFSKSRHKPNLCHTLVKDLLSMAYSMTKSQRYNNWVPGRICMTNFENYDRFDGNLFVCVWMEETPVHK